MKVVDFLRPELVLPELASTTKSGVLAEMARHLSLHLSGVEPEGLRKILEEREQLASTAIGDGVAIPPGKLDALGRSVGGVDFDSIDGNPTHIVFMLVAPASSTGVHLKALARLSRLFRDSGFRQRLLGAADAAAIYRVISEEDAKY